jgi:hypothetical protein
MVRPLPFLPSGVGHRVAKRRFLLRTLQSTSTAGGAIGLACWPKSLLGRTGMDKDTRVAPARILDLSQQMAQSATEARMLSLRIHEALLQARVPGYLEAYESGLGHLLGELTEN